jgi:methyl-accepting chemotaxis protein
LISASVERVAQGTVLVDQAGQTMQEVVESIQRVTEIMQTINTASQKQSLGMVEVGAAVNQIDETTQQNAALVEESAAAADSLKIQAKQLVDVVAVFQLGAGAPVRTSPQAVRPVGSRPSTARVGQVATEKRLAA